MDSKLGADDIRTMFDTMLAAADDFELTAARVPESSPEYDAALSTFHRAFGHFLAEWRAVAVDPDTGLPVRAQTRARAATPVG